MNQKALLAVGGVVVAALAAYFLFSSGTPNVPAPAPGGTARQGNDVAERSSLKALLAATQPQRCTFRDTSTVGVSEGTVFVAGGRMRGDFATVSNGQTVQAHLVVAGETSYTWVDGQSTGVKFSLNAAGDGSSQPASGVDVDKPVDYRCEPWAVDQTVFSLPSGVEFNDVSALLPPAAGAASAAASGGVETGGAPNLKAAQCAACDSAPEEARAQCRAALGC
jgi:hypothetical protein